ncbi:MAG: HNH endonuclease [Treponema sp.]|nr:HNH endonuclease [Treponema sp.]
MNQIYLQKFLELQADFYHYMVTDGNLSQKASHDYVTRLKFLAKDYPLDENLTLEVIQNILEQEKEKIKLRTVYATSHAIGDFKSGLNKFLDFIKSDYKKKLADSLLSDIEDTKNDSKLNETEKEQVIQARVGQGKFRSRLIEYWGGCALTRIPMVSILVASHIKAWRDSTNAERLELYNGLLLLPNYDKLFDKGYIAFNPKNGKLLCSKFIDEHDKEALGLSENMSLIKLEEQHQKFLQYHIEHYFMA